MTDYTQAQDPVFCQFVYWKMLSASANDKAKLSGPELKYFETPADMREFSYSPWFDLKLQMLTRLGVSWTMVMTSPRVDLDLAMSEISQKYSYADKAADMIPILKAGEMFAFGSKEISSVMHLSSTFCHGGAFRLDPDYERLRIAMDGKYNREEPDDLLEAAGVYSDLGALVLQAINGYLVATAVSGINELQLRVILLMLKHRYKYVSVNTIMGKTGKLNKKVQVFRALTSLVDQELVVKQKMDKRNVSYIITDKGVSIAMQFLNHIKRKAFYE